MQVSCSSDLDNLRNSNWQSAEQSFYWCRATFWIHVPGIGQVPGSEARREQGASQHPKVKLFFAGPPGANGEPLQGPNKDLYLAFVKVKVNYRETFGTSVELGEFK